MSYAAQQEANAVRESLIAAPRQRIASPAPLSPPLFPSQRHNPPAKRVRSLNATSPSPPQASNGPRALSLQNLPSTPLLLPHRRHVLHVVAPCLALAHFLAQGTSLARCPLRFEHSQTPTVCERATACPILHQCTLILFTPSSPSCRRPRSRPHCHAPPPHAASKLHPLFPTPPSPTDLTALRAPPLAPPSPPQAPRDDQCPLHNSSKLHLPHPPPRGTISKTCSSATLNRPTSLVPMLQDGAMLMIARRTEHLHHEQSLAETALATPERTPDMQSSPRRPRQTVPRHIIPPPTCGEEPLSMRPQGIGSWARR